MIHLEPRELAPLYQDHLEHLGRRYGAALERAGFSALVIHSGTPLRQRSVDDQFCPLRPTPAFAHWLPLAEPDCALIVAPGKRPHLVRPVVEDFWEGRPHAESDHFWSELELTEVADPDHAKEELPSGRLAFLGDDLHRAVAWGIAEAGRNPPALIAALDQVRAHKSDYERRCIAEANRRAALGHERVLDAFLSGPRSELELHLTYLTATEQDDAETPYKNIVAIGEHAAVLHHVRYDRRAPRGTERSLLIDAGATCLGYASDITRTAVRGQSHAAATFAELVVRVEEVQRTICAAVAPGVSYEDLHDRTHELLAPVLRDLGISSASDDELVGGGVTRRFFPHGLGHSLGLQVHDVGCRPRPPREENPYLRNTSEIAAGHVFTIEPGCYFIEPLLDGLRGEATGESIDWALVDRLRHFGGVRIEDNLAVTDDGTRNLTRDNWPDAP
jgi:Xaa-Pro dipeptidase